MYRLGGFHPRDTVTSKQNRASHAAQLEADIVPLPKEKGQGRRPASSLWLSWTSAPERTLFFPFLRRGENVIVRYKQWCTYPMNMNIQSVHLCTYMESQASTHVYVFCMYIHTYSSGKSTLMNIKDIYKYT